MEAMLSNFVRHREGSDPHQWGIRWADAGDLQYHRLQSEVLQWPEDKPVSRIVSALQGIRHHTCCRVTVNVLNPIEAVGKVVGGRQVIAYRFDECVWALPVSTKEINFDALVASSNKCLEGAPGMDSAWRQDLLSQQLAIRIVCMIFTSGED